MTATMYERRDEYGGVTIKRGQTGWIVETWSRWQGARSGRRVVVPYRDTYGPEADLDWDHNDYMTVGEYIVHLAGAPEARVLRRGTLVR